MYGTGLWILMVWAPMAGLVIENPAYGEMCIGKVGCNVNYNSPSLHGVILTALTALLQVQVMSQDIWTTKGK